METHASPADELPGLYRVILDGIAELEQRGERREAALVRAEATRVYSASWDQGGRRRLEALARRIDRVLAGDERARVQRTRGLASSRRSFAAR